MATTCITNNCRRDWLNGRIDFGNDTFKGALYNGSGHGYNTGAYTATNEVSSSGTNYTTGGNALTSVTITVDTNNNVAFVDCADLSWASSTITATDVLIYDDTVTTPTADVSIYVGDFGGSKSSSSGTFTVVMPAAAYNTAVIRIA